MFIDEFAELMLSYGIRFSRGVPCGKLSALEEALSGCGMLGFRQCVNGTQAISEALGYAQLNVRPPLLCLAPNDVRLLSQIQNSSEYGFGCVVVSLLGSYSLSGCDMIIVDEFIENPVQEIWQKLSQLGKLERPVVIRVAPELLVDSSYKVFGYNTALSHETVLNGVINQLGDNDVLVTSCGQVSNMVRDIRDENASFVWYEMPLAQVSAFSFAASIADILPDKTVWCVEGDGGCTLSLVPRLSGLSQWHPNLRHIVLCDGLADGARSGLLWMDVRSGLGITRGGNMYLTQAEDGFVRMLSRLMSEKMFACLMAVVSGG